MKTRLAFLIPFVMLLAPAFTYADGCFLPAPEYYMLENNQIAFIRHEAGREDLSILPRFHGDARDFAWIVPVPALPDLQADDAELFLQAQRLTAPAYRQRDGWDCFNEDEWADAGAPLNVQILAEETVGIYRTMTIGADNAQALIDSLTVWEYLRPGNVDAITPILTDYVDRGWFFVTMKVDEELLEGEYPYLGDYWYGEMQPIRMSFDSTEMVYPLRISSISADETSDVILYTVAAHRMDYPLATTMYANRISAGELDGIRRLYPLVGDWLEEDDFLTKLTRTYTPSQMTGDLVIVPAESDAEFRPVIYGGFPLFGILIAGSAIGWWGLRVTRRIRRSRNVKTI